MARLALLSDIHGNLPALKAILARLDKEEPDNWICLGDIVGYGPHFKECIELIRKRNIRCVLGNHDAGVAGILTTKHFRNPNRKLINLTRNKISKDELEWLRKLPLTISDDDSWIAAHASPVEPQKWMYVDSAIKARKILEQIDQRICFVGHTHIPGIVSEKIGIIKLDNENKFLVNPGSVGQSRDNDPRASCAIINTENWELQIFREEYNIPSVIADLTNLGFTRSESHQLMRQ